MGVALLVGLLVAALTLFLVLLPIKLAAGWLDAPRNGWGACLVAVIVSWIIVGIAQKLFHLGGGIVALLLTGLVYQFILGVGYFRGLGIAVVQAIITVAILLLVFATVLGPMLASVLPHATK